MTEDRLYTIGYQGVSLEQLIDSLEAAGVTLVIDTRETPMSRRADFRRGRLSDELSARAIVYVGIPALGAPKALRSQVGHWPTFEAGYRSRIAKQGDTMAQLAELVKRDRVCLLCFEDDPMACHRSILVEELERHLGQVTTLHLRPGRVDQPDDREGVGMLLHGAHS
jgi:uncharacterized protein (DUF488 family)